MLYLKVLVGDNASLLSCRLLANVAQGRGATLPMDTVSLSSGTLFVINSNIISYNVCRDFLIIVKM